MSWHRAGVLLLGAQSCLPVPGVPAVGGIGSVLLSMARMGWKLCHVFRLYTVVMAGSVTRRGLDMTGFVLELRGMCVALGYPHGVDYCHVLINSSRNKNHFLKGIIELIKIRKEIGKH
uniref:OSJNBa0085C10.13 protein n=1 Tax=Oryza sativa subsp. japonica TaxID=39947 RepID=Q7XWI1_ORYSJ|nr:OSJNBa0085C10.13 [Oryza sativa Japonica Group]